MSAQRLDSIPCIVCNFLKQINLMLGTTSAYWHSEATKTNTNAQLSLPRPLTAGLAAGGAGAVRLQAHTAGGAVVHWVLALIRLVAALRALLHFKARGQCSGGSGCAADAAAVPRRHGQPPYEEAGLQVCKGRRFVHTAGGWFEAGVVVGREAWRLPHCMPTMLFVQRMILLRNVSSQSAADT